MVVLVSFIVISFMFYLFYKMKQYRTNWPATKKWYSSKANIALGFFIFLFGANQLILFKTTVTYVVGAIFIVIGVINIIGGFKRFKYYYPLAVEESERVAKEG